MDRSYRTAKTLARVLLDGKLDQAGVPMFEHAARVREILGGADYDLSATLAWLHDLVEDTPLSLDDLHELGFSPGIVAAVDSLTRRDGEVYTDYIERVARDPMAVPVKIADLRDHIRRADHLPEGSSLRARYIKALFRLAGGHYDPRSDTTRTA